MYSSTEERRKAQKEFYKEQWDFFTNLLEGNQRSLGRIILIVGTGSFAVSITFLTGLKENLTETGYLLGSWIFLAASIITLASSHLLETWRMEYLLHRLKVWNGLTSAGVDVPWVGNKMKLQLFLGWASVLLVVVSFLALLIGVVAMMLFGVHNIPSNTTELQQIQTVEPKG